MYSEIAYEVSDGVLTLTLNRPDALNAVTMSMVDELLDAFDRSDADDDVRVVVVTGRGRAFCAGADMSMGDRTFERPEGVDESGQRWRDEGGLISLRIFRSLKPVIAAINGPAVGVGVTMTLPMDIRLASETARIGFVFARRGIVPEAASSWFLPRVVGISRAMEWAATGRIFPASEALEGGLVRSVHPPDELLPSAYALAREIADNTSPVSVTLIRQMMWRTLGESHPMAGHRLESLAIAALGRTADVREGVDSFLEKRPAQFRSKVSRDMPDFFPWWEEPEFDA